MSTEAVIAIVVLAAVIVLLVAAVAAASRKRRSSRPRGEFGAEDDRTVQDAGKRRRAEKGDSAGEGEREDLQLRPLTPAARERYTASWAQLQAKFVAAPVIALNEADTLLTQLMADRGYPTDSIDAQSRLLSVEPAHLLDGYRPGHDVEFASGMQQATVEDLGNAMLYFRRVFEHLMATDESAGRKPYRTGPSDQPQTSANPRPRQRR
jgi:hypothetical protein